MSANNQRIQQLRGLSKLILLIGLPVLVYLLFFYSPSPVDDQEREAIRISIADLGEGEHKLVPWKGRRLLVLHRSSSMIQQLEEQNYSLYDENSRMSFQPEYVENRWRSIDPVWWVGLTQSPDTGCEVVLTDSGFEDPCRGSKYDWSGRVLKDQLSKRNLEVPGQRIEGENLYAFEY